MTPAPVRFIRSSALLLLTAVALPVLASGCDLFTGPGRDGPAPVQTSKDEYTLRLNEAGDQLGVDIPFRYENRTNRPIYLLSCKPPVLEKRRGDGSWEGVWSRIVLCGIPTPADTIQPGEIYRGRLPLFHHLEPNVYPRMLVEEIDGTYRLHLVGAVFPDAGDTWGYQAVPEPMRSSNPFSLTRE